MTLLTKYPEETYTYGMDFAGLLQTGESLSGTPGLTVSRLTGRGTLTLGSVSAVGSQVRVAISGGSIGAIFELVFTSPTSLGNTPAAGGRLRIARV